MRILALDLGKSKSVVCEYDSENGRHTFVTIRTRPQEVHDLLVERAPGRVVIEAGPSSGWVHDLAKALGSAAPVANTNHEIWRWRRTTKKTDRTDALRLARLSVLEQLPTVYMPSKEVRQWRSLIEYRHTLVKRRTAIKNSIRAILEREGLAWKAGQSGWSQESLEVLRRMAEVLGDVTEEFLWQGQLAVELEMLSSVAEALGVVTEKLNALGAQKEPVRLLQSAPGVGARLAEAVVACLATPHRFKSGKQVGRYAGLTPRQYQSGEQDRKGRISGQGNSTLRALLVEVSWLMLRWNAWARETYARLLRGGGGRKKVAIVALSRKLLVRLWAMWRDGTRWRAEAPPVATASG